MTFFIRKMSDFTRYAFANSISAELPIMSNDNANGQLTFVDTITPAMCGDWLEYDGKLWVIESAQPDNGLINVTVRDVFNAFNRKLIYPSISYSTAGAFIESRLTIEYMNISDEQYQMPYIRVADTSTVGMIAPDFESEILFSLGDYMRKVSQRGVKIEFQILSTGYLNILISDTPSTEQRIIFGDGHHQLISQEFSTDITAKVTTVIDGAATDYYLYPNGAISTVPPLQRVDGKWETIVTDADRAGTAVADIFAKNSANFKSEFYADVFYDFNTPVELWLEKSWVQAAISYVGISDRDNRYHYKAGDRPTTLTEKIRAISKTSSSSSSSGGGGGGITVETDPIFSVSPAAGITDADIQSWDNKSDFSGSYNDLTDKPTIPAAQVNSDWNATSGKAQILNKPTIPTVDTSLSSTSTNPVQNKAIYTALGNKLNSSDIASWAKQSSKPSYTKSEVGLGNVANERQYSANNPPPDASTSSKGIVQLNSSTNSTSTTQAATPSAVKSAYDLANGKYSKPSSGIPKTDLANAVQTSLGKADNAIQKNMTATASSLSAGASPTVSYNSSTNVMSFGIPKGDKGDTGGQGPQGVTFTPSVSSAGVISWTNDGGRQNPSSVNIKGPQGAAGAAGHSPSVTASKSGTVTTIKVDGTSIATINDGATGPQGPQGEPGPVNSKNANMWCLYKDTSSMSNDYGLGQCIVFWDGVTCIVEDFGFDEGVRLIEFLRSKSITKVDAVIISHYHSDHVTKAAVQRLLSSGINLTGCTFYLPHWSINWASYFPTGTSTEYKTVETNVINALSGRTAVRPTSEGYSVTHGDFKLEFYNVSSSYYSDYYGYHLNENLNDNGHTNYNNFSMVTMVTYAGITRILLPADIEYPAEEKMKDLAKVADVVVVPHHGLNCAEPQSFVDSVKASVSVIPAYYDNRVQAISYALRPVSARCKELGTLVSTLDHDVCVHFGTGGIYVDAAEENLAKGAAVGQMLFNDTNKHDDLNSIGFGTFYTQSAAKSAGITNYPEFSGTRYAGKIICSPSSNTASATHGRTQLFMSTFMSDVKFAFRKYESIEGRGTWSAWRTLEV